MAIRFKSLCQDRLVSARRAQSLKIDQFQTRGNTMLLFSVAVSR